MSFLEVIVAHFALCLCSNGYVVAGAADVQLRHRRPRVPHVQSKLLDYGRFSFTTVCSSRVPSA